MKPYLYFFLILFISCEIKSEQPLPVSKDTTANSQDKKHSKPIVKYVFAVFEVNEPHLKYFPPEYINDKFFEETALTEWTTRTYCSDINEFENFTDEQGTALLQECSKQIPTVPSEYLNDVIKNVRSISSIEALSKERTKIISGKYLEFDNFNEAVSEREKILKNGK